MLLKNYGAGLIKCRYKYACIHTEFKLAFDVSGKLGQTILRLKPTLEKVF